MCRKLIIIWKLTSVKSVISISFVIFSKYFVHSSYNENSFNQSLYREHRCILCNKIIVLKIILFLLTAIVLLTCGSGRSQNFPNTDFLLAVLIKRRRKRRKRHQQSQHSKTNTHKITTQTRQLQQYTQSNNINYTKDNLKLARSTRDKLEYNMYKR